MAPKFSGSGWVASVSRVIAPNVPPPPPFSAQNRSGSCDVVDDPHLAVGGDDLGLDQAGAAVPKPFEKLPKPPPCTRPATPTVVQPPPCT